MITLEHHNNLTRCQQAIVDAFWGGHTSDKAMANHLGISQAAVRTRMRALLFRIDVPFGTRREQAMISMLDRGLIKIRHMAAQAAMVLLCVLSATGGGTDNHALRTRSRGHGRAPVASMARVGRRAEYFIDPKNLEAA